MEYKAYSFDLDDNLLKLPTKVYLEDKEGNRRSFPTLEFEKIKPALDELGLMIVDDSFEQFEDDEQFLRDIEKSVEAGSWKNLVNCVVQHASIFAIITARGQSPDTIREGMKFAIKKHFSKEHLNKFVKNFCNRYNIEEGGVDEILDQYLNLCKFYPVHNGTVREKFGSKDTSELKSLAFEDFQKYITKHVEENFGKDIKIKIGFSDDSILHLSKIVNDILKKHGLFFYRTSDSGKSNFI